MSEARRRRADALGEHPLVQQAREFSALLLRPHAGEFDAAEAVPREVINEMAARGILGAVLPRRYGGGGVDALCYGRVTKEIGKGCSSARALLTVHASLVGETLVRLGSAEQRQRWLPAMASGERLACFALTEPSVGTDAGSVETSYRRDGGGYVLNGRKKWITFAAEADLFLVIASCRGQVSAFMVEREMDGVSVERMSGLLGNRGAHTAEVRLDEVRVPPQNLIGRTGTGFTFITNTALFYGRYSIAWAGVALAEAALEEMVAYSRRRSQFGKKICQHQLIQRIIADAVTKVHASQALCEKIGALRVAGDDQAVMETNIAKYYTARAAAEVTADAVQVFGGNGCWSRFPVERLFREAKILEIIEGTAEVQQLLISGFGLGRYFTAGARAARKAAKNGERRTRQAA